MSKIISIQYSMIEENFLQNFQENIEEFSDLNCLEISNIPTSANGLELIAQPWFKEKVCSHDSIFGIKLKIDEEISDNFNEKPQYFDFKFKEAVFIVFQSTQREHESKTFWKVPDRENFYSLFIDNDQDEEICTFFHDFLIEELKNGRSGILQSYKNKENIQLQEIGDVDGNNLLMIAARNSNVKIAEKLLTREFDVDDMNIAEDAAINIAWNICINSKNDDEIKEKSNQIILCLLNANSAYPVDFYYDDASIEVKEFVDMCEETHKTVDNNEFDILEKKIEEYPNLTYFYDRDNKSLVMHALRTEKLKIIDFLEKEITIGTHEVYPPYFKHLKKENLKALRDKHHINAKVLPKTHILILRSKTKVYNNDKFVQNRWKIVEEVYETLDQDPFCSKLLKIAAEVKKLKIRFDFKNDSIFYADPSKSTTVLGTTYIDGKMIIGAKNLLNENKKEEVLGIIAHEFCHLAMLVSFMNPDFDPFPVGESDAKKRFVEEVMVECKEKQEEEKIMKYVFKYAKKLQTSELIVTVAEMLILYRKNSEKIAELRVTFKNLFDYCKDIVEPELDRALPVLQKLEDPEINIRYESLTEAMKKRILNINVNFQGEKTILAELIGSDHPALKTLTPDNIRDMLIRGNTMNISGICELKMKYMMIERNFIDRKVYEKAKTKKVPLYEKCLLNNSKSTEDVKSQVIDSKRFILADYAGTGKTTAFKDFARKIKKDRKDYWVSYVNLRRFQPVFVESESKIETLTLADAVNILEKIVDQTTEFEKLLFRHLFSTDHVVLLFDGLDEICPKNTEIMMKIFQIFNENEGNKNELWISTRPHYARNVEEVFEIPAFTFVFYNMEQKVQFIKEILKQNNITDEKEQVNIIGKVNAYIFRMEFNPTFHSDNDYPLIIEIITELHVQKGLKLDLTGHYGLYAGMIEKQKEKIGEKVPNLERDPFTNLSVWQVHQVLALIVVIGDTFERAIGFKLEDLSIMKTWKTEWKNKMWTSDMIQRYGFVTSNLTDESYNNRSLIDFAHMTYAEFFVAKFLIDFLFSHHLNDAEMIKMMKLFQIAQGSFPNIVKFMHSYMKTDARRDDRIFCDTIREYFDREISGTIEIVKEEGVKNVSDPFIFFSRLYVFDDALTEKLWKLKDEQNILEWLVINDKISFLEMFTETIEFVFGENWHEKFNKNETKLITDEHIESMRDEVVKNWEYWRAEKNLLKFFDYVHKNFDIDVQKTQFDKIDLFFRFENNSVRMEVLNIFEKTYDAPEFIEKCLPIAFHLELSPECLKFVFEKIEQSYRHDRESMRKLLFEELRGDNSLLFNAIESQNLELISITKDLYARYKNSDDEIKKIIMEVDTTRLVETIVESKIYQEHKVFIEELFGLERSDFAAKVKDFIHTDGKVAKEWYDNAEDFVKFIFSIYDDQEMIDDLLDYLDYKDEFEGIDYNLYIDEDEYNQHMTDICGSFCSTNFVYE